jgi:GT2 family glycosyltransferase
VIVLDADMILPRETLDEILSVAGSPSSSSPLAYWIPEVRTGSGIRTRARNFERSFYDGTAIDALRLFHKSVLEKTGGYDENLIAGPEDWELDIRVLAAGTRCAVLGRHLVHNERELSFGRLMAKKAYYSKSMAAYQAKWKGHPALKRQFGLCYRYFGVFVENGKWRRLLRHPVLAAVMYFERIAVGFVYLASVLRRRP